MSWWIRQFIERRETPRSKRLIVIFTILTILVMAGFPLATYARVAPLEQPAATPISPASPTPTLAPLSPTTAPGAMGMATNLQAPITAVASPAVSVPGSESCDPTISITSGALDFGSSTWEDPGYSPSTGHMELTISAAGTDCTGMTGGWTIQVSASPMDGPGDAVIPASAISYKGTAADTDPPNGLSVEASSLSLDTTNSPTTRIATGSQLVQGGATWDVAFQVDPPDDALPGVYAGTITIDITNGS